MLAVMLPTIEAKNAPMMNWASIATLMTAARSHRQPARAPRISGVAIASVPGSGFTILASNAPEGWSEYAQIRKPSAKATPATPIASIDRQPLGSQPAAPATPTHSTSAAQTHSVGFDAIEWTGVFALGTWTRMYCTCAVWIASAK